MIARFHQLLMPAISLPRQQIAYSGDLDPPDSGGVRHRPMDLRRALPQATSVNRSWHFDAKFFRDGGFEQMVDI